MTGDGGIDEIIRQDRLALDKVYVQAKRYAEERTVSAGEVCDLAGALQMRKATKGVLLTTSSFTKDAADTARQIGSIVLVNGAQLAQLMIQYDLGVATEVVYPVKKVDQDVFDEWSCSAAASDVRYVDSDRFGEEVVTGVVGRYAELWMV